MATTIDLQVSANDDDGHERESDRGVITNSTSIYVYGGGDWVGWHGGIVFNNVTVPQGYVIDAATLELNCTDLTYDDIDCTIKGNDVDNANDLVVEAEIDDRTLTTASTSWVQDSLGTGWKTSPSIKNIVQEIVNRGGWISGNSMMFALLANISGSKQFRFWAHDWGAGADAAKLHITYSVPVTAGGPSRGNLVIPCLMGLEALKLALYESRMRKARATVIPSIVGQKTFDDCRNDPENIRKLLDRSR